MPIKKEELEDAVIETKRLTEENFKIINKLLKKQKEEDNHGRKTK